LKLPGYIGALGVSPSSCSTRSANGVEFNSILIALSTFLFAASILIYSLTSSYSTSYMVFLGYFCLLTLSSSGGKNILSCSIAWSSESIYRMPLVGIDTVRVALSGKFNFIGFYFSCFRVSSLEAIRDVSRLLSSTISQF